MSRDDLFGPRTPLPEGFVYRPGFLTADEEAELIGIIRGLPLEEAQYLQYTARRRIVSYGGSSLILSMLSAGILLNVSRRAPEPSSRAGEIRNAPAGNKRRRHGDRVRVMVG